MGANLYTVYAVILAFTFLTTLRYSIAGTLVTGNPVLRAVTHPYWLYALVAAGPFVLGSFYQGALSPWPPDTFAQVNARAGMWAAIAATLGVMIADIWMFWGAATTFRRFAPPHDKRVVKLYYLANAAIGLYLVGRFLHVIPVGELYMRG